MTRTDLNAPRPVSFATIIVILVGFGLFLFLTHWVVHSRHTLPTYGTAEGVPADQAWQATPAGRRQYMLDLKAKQQKQLASYAWVDRKAEVVQLPIDQAMALVAHDYGASK